MHYCTLIRTVTSLLLLEVAGGAIAQGTSGSPYSAYGFGDVIRSSQVTQAIMGDVGVAFTEPYSLVLANPASYVGLDRPVFESGIALRSTHFLSDEGDAFRKDINFTGFTIGVPFAKGKWGLALGMVPYTDVDYVTSSNEAFDEGTVEYTYTGTGGLQRAFFGLAHTIYQHPTDSLGNTGVRVMLGANFNYIFGNSEQTREANYPANAGFTNTRAFSSLVLHAPNADIGLLWQGDLIRKTRKDGRGWRYNIGVTTQLPVDFAAKASELVTSYTSSSGIVAVRDTIFVSYGLKGRIEIPYSLGIGASVQNARWLFTAEIRTRDWSALKLDVPSYGLPAPLSATTAMAVGARFRPSNEGSLFKRAVYRAGLRHEVGPLEVHDRVLTQDAVSCGVSLPLNAVQTNSFLHLGGEYGQRGTTDDGLLEERYFAFWVGFTFTPWRGERWFSPPKIQ